MGKSLVKLADEKIMQHTSVFDVFIYCLTKTIVFFF